MAVHNFFSDEECDALREKADGKLKPCVTFGASGARTNLSDYRTSSEALCPQREVPTLVRRLTALLRCEPLQLQTFNIVRYTAGQQFKPHVDTSSGRSSRPEAGFYNSTRLVSIMCDAASCDPTLTHASTTSSPITRTPIAHRSHTDCTPIAHPHRPRSRLHACSVYLNSPRRGGHTVFPLVGRAGLRVKPTKARMRNTAAAHTRPRHNTAQHFTTPHHTSPHFTTPHHTPSHHVSAVPRTPPPHPHPLIWCPCASM